ncbi:tetratricopeptide repeat protein [Cylindrospermum sp. FACHB-282]|uniref:tetratricopeptide repeat protein n=1 Tax=Cylindrospermum sp. FACHB-282 TaxID=2692794 RepID=UPI0016864C16|nr:tetratricopeptide repeat protein [Cylindrospermum sp. FACHB-282]MBD2384161.1 tetratricopeptide repeat protein [Cylindrospermum sp. FACHB-282]
MAISGDDYLVKRGKQIERRKRIVTYLSIVSFGGSMLFAGVNTLQQAWQNPQQSVVESAEAKLQVQVKGYELVLKQEPNNQAALEKLSLLRLQLKDTKGSMEIMEKLVKLHPDRQDYKVLLEQMKKQYKQSDS